MDELRDKDKNFSHNYGKYRNLNKNSSDSDFGFDDIIKVAKRRKKLLIFASLTISGFITFNSVITRIFNPTYKGTFSLLINDPLSNEENLTADNAILLNIAKNTTSNDIPTLITLLKSPSLLNDIGEKYSISYIDLNRMIFIENIIIDRRRADGILKVNIKINNKKKGFDILNDISKKYLEAALKQKQTRISDGLEFLNQQVPAVQRKTLEIERELEEFRKKYSIIEPTEEGLSLKEQEKFIEREIFILETNKNRLIDLKKEIVDGKLTAKSFKEIINNSSPTASGDKGLEFTDIDQGLLTTLIRLDNELAEATTIYTPESKIIKGLKKRVEEIKPLFLKNQLEAVDTSIDLAESIIETKKARRDLIKKEFLINPSLIKEFNNLQLRLEVTYQNLNNLLASRELFQLQMAQTSLPWKVIAPPEMSEKPVNPSIPRDVIFGIIIGLISGVILALIRDRMDFVFHSSKEIEEDLKYPILANIPYIDNFKAVREQVDLFLESFSEESSDSSEKKIYQTFFYQESLRTLFTSLRFSGNGNTLKVISITSSVPKEGKSLVNLLFAKTLSDLGQKVLLIDGDMRKPTLHKRLKKNNIKGLSNYLSNANASFESIVQNCESFANLDLITSGPIPPDSTRLISSERMQKLITNLKNNSNYDYILIDLPPVLGLSDVPLVVKNIDGIILLTSVSFVKRNLPLESISSIKCSGGNVIGLLVNNIKKADKSYENDYKFAYAEYVEKSDSDMNKIDNQNNLTFSSNKFLNSLLDSNPFFKSFILRLKNLNDKFFKWIDN